jgi:hypothetical protein
MRPVTILAAGWLVLCVNTVLFAQPVQRPPDVVGVPVPAVDARPAPPPAPLAVPVNPVQVLLLFPRMEEPVSAAARRFAGLWMGTYTLNEVPGTWEFRLDIAATGGDRVETFLWQQRGPPPSGRIQPDGADRDWVSFWPEGTVAGNVLTLRSSGSATETFAFGRLQGRTLNGEFDRTPGGGTWTMTRYGN